MAAAFGDDEPEPLPKPMRMPKPISSDSYQRLTKSFKKPAKPAQKTQESISPDAFARLARLKELKAKSFVNTDKKRAALEERKARIMAAIERPR